MTIVLLAEGKTETALRERLKRFLDGRALAAGRARVALRIKPLMTMSEARLRGRIRLELSDPEVTAVVGLVDVYPEFSSAAEAKEFLSRAAGVEPRFYAHAAQYEVEAWLLPFWDAICAGVGVHRARPGPNPETVNLERPPSRRLDELYRLARPVRKYNKVLDMPAILDKISDEDLVAAANQCPEFKALLNTLLALGGLAPLA